MKIRHPIGKFNLVGTNMIAVFHPLNERNGGNINHRAFRYHSAIQ